MRKLVAAAFSLLFIAVTFGPAYAQRQPFWWGSSSPSFSNPTPTNTTMRISSPPVTTTITLNVIRDLVASETFVQESGFWQWKYEGYSFEGFLPPIPMYWVEIFQDETCYVPVFYTSSGYPYIVIRLNRGNSLCGENKDEKLKEYVAGKYIKGKILSYVIMGDLQKKDGYIEIMIMPE